MWVVIAGVIAHSRDANPGGEQATIGCLPLDREDQASRAVGGSLGSRGRPPGTV